MFFTNNNVSARYYSFNKYRPSNGNRNRIGIQIVIGIGIVRIGLAVCIRLRLYPTLYNHVFILFVI